MNTSASSPQSPPDIGEILAILASSLDLPVSSPVVVAADAVAREDSPARQLHLATHGMGLRSAGVPDVRHLLDRRRNRLAALAGWDGGTWWVVTRLDRRRPTLHQIDGRGSLQTAMPRRALYKLLAGRGGIEWMLFTYHKGLDPLVKSPPQAGQTARTSQSPWDRLRGYISLEQSDLIVVAVYAIVIGALTLMTPIAAQALVNTIAFGTVVQPLVVLTVALFAGLSFMGLLGALEYHVVEILKRRAFIRVAEDLSERLPRVSRTVRDRINLPELTNRFFDVITIQKAGSELLLAGLSLSLQLLVGLILLGLYHPILLVFDLVLVGLLALALRAGRGGARTAVDESKAKYRVAAWLEELARVPDKFSSRRGHDLARAEIAARCDQYLRNRRKHYQSVVALLAGGLTLQVLAIVALLGVGGWLVINRQLTLGQLVAAELVISATAFGFGKLGALGEKAFDLVAALDKIGAIVDLPLEQQVGEIPPAHAPMRIRAERILAGYGDSTDVISQTSFEVESGARTLLGGPTGAGKSLVLDVLATHRPIAGGRVWWNGSTNPDRALLRDDIALARDGHLIAARIIDNLRLAAPDITTSDARELLKLVGLSAEIDRLPDGMATELLPSGAPLSPRQARRLILATALANNPRLLLIDEILDDLGLAPADHDRLLDFITSSERPWTLVVVSNHPAVVARLTDNIDLRLTAKEAA